MFKQTPQWVSRAVTALAILWLISIVLIVVPLFPIDTPISADPTTGVALTSAIASAVLVVVTVWQVTSHRELVEETRESRMQESSPLLVPAFPQGLVSNRSFTLRNNGKGPAFDVTGRVILTPQGDESLIWDSAPIILPGEELLSHTQIQTVSTEEIRDHDDLSSKHEKLLIEVEYRDVFDREKKETYAFDLDFRYEMHNAQSIEDR